MTNKYDALEALEGKATKGPWGLSHDGHGGVRIESGNVQIGFASSAAGRQEANAQLIAAARNAVPTLIADVKALAEALEGIYQAVDSCVDLTPEVMDSARAALKRIQGEAL